jgi:hypothetical protein
LDFVANLDFGRASSNPDKPDMHAATSAPGSPHPQANSPVPIFWTGGWDSTYRVLELALTLRKTVLPIYLHDDTRRCAKHELRAIHSVLDRLTHAHPEARARILPLRTIPMTWHLVPDDPFSRDLMTIRAHTEIGAQYAYIAREMHRAGLDAVEMCVHVGPRASSGPHSHFANLFAGRLEPVREHGLLRWRLARPTDHDPLSRLFGRLRFPLHDITKRQTRERARALGFEPLLHLTWFCHHPRQNRPCGVCNPCQVTLKDGFGWRIGPVGHCRRIARKLPFHPLSSAR